MKTTILSLFAFTAAAMAQVKVSELPAAGTITGAETVMVIQSAASKKSTIDAVADYIRTGYLTEADAATTYQPLTAPLTAFAGLANAAGFLTNNGSGTLSWTGTSTGGNGAADDGKAVIFANTGAILAQTYVRVQNTGATAYTGIVTNGISGLKNGQFMGINWPSSPSGPRIWTHPDASGTYAFIGISQTFSGANIFSGANTFSAAGQLNTAAGAASTPAMSYTGQPYTGGTGTTTKPLFMVETTGATSTAWSTAGTLLGINADGSFTGRLFDAQANGISYCTIAPALFKVRATELRLTYSTPLWFGPTDSVDTSLYRIGAGNLGTNGKITAGIEIAQSINVSNGLFNNSGVTTELWVSGGTVLGCYLPGRQIYMPSDIAVGWGSTTWTTGSYGTGRDLVIGRAAAASLRIGLDHATTPTDQTIKAHDVTTGTGAAITIAGGKGSVAGGAVILATSATTGTAAARLTIAADGSATFTGSVAIGNGTPITAVLSNVASKDFDLTALTVEDQTMTVTGAAVGDVVELGVPHGSTTATSQFSAWVSASDTVTIRCRTEAAGENPASGSFRATVVKH